MTYPLLGHLGIGQIVLVQDFDTGLVPIQFSQNRIGTTHWQTSIENLDNHINSW
jgi:hypothetical protein